ncbi:MAG: hypothetical protein ACEQSQ_03770, partial [Candidatus Paceibacteria bacterium]
PVEIILQLYSFSLVVALLLIFLHLFFHFSYSNYIIILLYFIGGVIIFESLNKRQERIYANSISDIALFLQEISKQNYFIDESEKIYKKEKKLYFIMMFLLIIFGLNGYFEICCLDNDFVDIISSLSKLLLGIVILTSPIFWLLAKWNERKIQSEVKE